jgi:hypothetical protein
MFNNTTINKLWNNWTINEDKDIYEDFEDYYLNFGMGLDTGDSGNLDQITLDSYMDKYDVMRELSQKEDELSIEMRQMLLRVNCGYMDEKLG